MSFGKGQIGWYFGSVALAAAIVAAGTAPGRAAEADQEELKEAERTLNEAKMALDGPALLAFIMKRTVPEIDRAKIATLVRQLGDDDFQVRKKAFQDLQATGRAALPFLKDALTSGDAEIVSSATALLKRIEDGSEAVVMAAAARVLAVRKPEGAAKVLLAYLPLAGDDDEVQEAFMGALAAVGLKGGKVDEAVAAAATDKDPARRAAAAFVLARAGADQRGAVRRLLKDPDDRVRYQAATALVQARDQAAVDALITLLTSKRENLIWQSEDLLLRVAAAGGEKSPPTLDASTAESRARGKEEWAKWWKDHSARVDLAKVGTEKAYKGVTLVCEYSGSGMNGQGRVWVCGRDGKQRWELPGSLGSPLDARLLPNGNILLSEYGSARVTERDKKGNIVWEMANLGNVCCAQRLRNGNTLIASTSQLIEVNKKKETVFQIQGQTYYARKLRNNHIVYTSADQVVELDGTRKEVARIRVQGCSWGSVDKLPNGNYLVAVYGGGRVAEVDKTGKEVWSVNIASPTLALRLRNGHTLVASTSTNTVAEFDRAGKQVWSQRTQGQAWRARRY
jgi:HEAT repeat protein